MRFFLNKCISFIVNSVEFKSRMWVVNISDSGFADETFVLNEDDFSEPLQWMKRKGYSSKMLAEVNNMNTSQTSKFFLEKAEHSLIRVK